MGRSGYGLYTLGNAMSGFSDSSVTSGSRDSIGAIDELWFQAMAGEFHGPFCKCFGGSAMTLDPGSLETDVLDYLLPRYAAEQLDSLVGLLKQRQAMPVGSFVDWLRDLPDPTVNQSLYFRLFDDVGSILSSIGSARTGFACT
jgi:hypothetical protein